MRSFTIAICCLFAGVALIAQTQVRPDFSAEWVLDPSRTVTTGAPARVGGPGPGGATPLGTVTEPKKIKNVYPKYPPDAARERISGIVMLEATIDRQGHVDDLRVLRSVPKLDRAAMEAVSKWEYTPTLLDGIPVSVIMTVTVTFSLGTAAPPMGTPPRGGTPPAQISLPGGGGGPGRSGLGRGFVAPSLRIAQDDTSLRITRTVGDYSETIAYRFDGTASSNRLPGTGGAVDNTYVYVSRWDGDKLVTSITWTGPQGPRERTETISVDGDTLTMRTSRAALDPGAEPMVTTNVFNRKK